MLRHEVLSQDRQACTNNQHLGLSERKNGDFVGNFIPTYMFHIHQW